MEFVAPDANDPPYHPNGKRKAPARGKPFAWLSDQEDPENLKKLNALLNYVGYRASPVDAPAIHSAAQACVQLLRNDLPYRKLLKKVATIQGCPGFVYRVRNGLRGDTDRPGPFYTYLGTDAHTPTAAEHAEWLANNPPPALATATTVSTGTTIPPRPDCPVDPGPPPAKPEGNRYPAKHPFTEDELKFFTHNPHVSFPGMFFELYKAYKQPEGGMFLAMSVCCRLVTPLKFKENMLEWTRRIAADLRWQGVAVDSQITADSDIMRVCYLAYSKGIKVMAPLDNGPVPPKEVTQAQEDEYHRLKCAHDKAVQAYKCAQRKLKAYDKKYGAVIPPAPDESEVCVTGHTTWAQRDAMLRKEAVDLCSYEPDEPAKRARVAPAPAPAVAQTGGMDIDKLAKALGVTPLALGEGRPTVKAERARVPT